MYVPLKARIQLPEGTLLPTILALQPKGEVVLHNTMFWGNPDRSGTVRGGALVLQQGTFTRHGNGFAVLDGSLSMIGVNYLAACGGKQSHLVLKGKAAAALADYRDAQEVEFKDLTTGEQTVRPVSWLLAHAGTRSTGATDRP